jgi:membrane protein DedA with SNARE-associated domain
VATLTTFAIALPGSPALAYVVLALIVGSESSGIPLPGETTLFLGAFAAHDGKLSIVLVIAVAAAGAIIGDNLGYLFGRRLGRDFLERPGRFEKHRREALVRGDEFFARHGSKAVFLGRWITGLRVWASWLAGITHLPWLTFLFWNALGGICWATSVGLAGYFAGHAAEKLIQRVGLVALIAFVVGAAAGYLLYRRRRARRRLSVEQDRAGVRPEPE